MYYLLNKGIIIGKYSTLVEAISNNINGYEIFYSIGSK